MDVHVHILLPWTHCLTAPLIWASCLSKYTVKQFQCHAQQQLCYPSDVQKCWTPGNLLPNKNTSGLFALHAHISDSKTVTRCWIWLLALEVFLIRPIIMVWFIWIIVSLLSACGGCWLHLVTHTEGMTLILAKKILNLGIFEHHHVM